MSRDYLHRVTYWAQFLVLLAGSIIQWQGQSQTGWLVCLPILACISFFAWLSALRYLRKVRDYPISKIASAAQGYVGLQGKGQWFDKPFITPASYSKKPCLWYRYQIEKKNIWADKSRGVDSPQGGFIAYLFMYFLVFPLLSKYIFYNWETIESGESEEAFLLNDGTGICVIDPKDAEVITKKKHRWTDFEGHRHTEWILSPNVSVYAIGQFNTINHSNASFDANEELKALLAKWKQDPKNLLKRFDLNNDGTLGMQEWTLARQAARREAETHTQEIRSLPDVSTLSCSADGRPYLISELRHDDLVSRYLFWSWAHFIMFFGALGGIAWLLRTHF